MPRMISGRQNWYEGSAVSATTRRHLFANEQGSIALVTNATGFTVLGKNAYDAYGIPKGAATATSADDNIGRFQYTGQIWLPELGMYYYKARMMSPTLGRFMQTDPIGYDDGMNWHNYVGSDPVNFVDPTGLAGRCVYPDDAKKDCEAKGGKWIEDDDGPADILVNGLKAALGAIRAGGDFGDGVINVIGLRPKKKEEPIASLPNAGNGFSCAVVTEGPSITVGIEGLNFLLSRFKFKHSGRAQGKNGANLTFVHNVGTPTSTEGGGFAPRGVTLTYKLTAYHVDSRAVSYKHTVTSIPLPGGSGRNSAAQKFNVTISAPGGGNGSCKY